MHFKRFNTNKDRGLEAEKAVQKALGLWAETFVEGTDREFNRLVDTKSAGRTIKAAAADFDYYARVNDAAFFGLIEAKQTEHLYRLDRDKLSQLPRLRLRTNCGGRCAVLVWHSVSNEWRALSVPFLMAPNDKGSWDLRSLPAFPTPRLALKHFLPEVFG